MLSVFGSIPLTHRYRFVYIRPLLACLPVCRAGLYYELPLLVSSPVCRAGLYYELPLLVSSPVCRAWLYYELPLLVSSPVCRAGYHLLCVWEQLIVSIKVLFITMKKFNFKIP